MNNSEMAATLREFADKIEATEIDMGLCLQLTSYSRSVENLDVLKSIVNLKNGKWESHSSGSNYYWIQYVEGDVNLTAHYPAGLLGVVTKTREVVVTSEKTDLSILGIN